MKTYGARIRLSEEEVEHIFSRREGIVSQPKKLAGPKVLVYDIETAPISAYVWSIWQDNAGVQGVVSDWFSLSWSAKWLFDSRIMSNVLTPNEALEEDDGRIMRELWMLIDEADILIGHNIDKFDVKKMNTRFIIHGLLPPSPYQTIDTLKAAKRSFAFSSNKLDYVNQLLGISRKMKNDGFDLWKRCLRGDGGALKTMDEYCRRDVGITEETYVTLRPWIKSHPNMGLYVDADGPVCPACQGEDLHVIGKYRTMVSEYDAFRCAECGSIGRYSTGQRKELSNRTQSIAR